MRNTPKCFLMGLAAHHHESVAATVSICHAVHMIVPDRRTQGSGRKKPCHDLLKIWVGRINHERVKGTVSISTGINGYTIICVASRTNLNIDEKIPLLTSATFRGDYPPAPPSTAVSPPPAAAACRSARRAASPARWRCLAAAGLGPAPAPPRVSGRGSGARAAS